MTDIRHLLDRIDRLNESESKGPWWEMRVAALAKTALPQLAAAVKDVLELHPCKTAFDGNLDYCPRCVNYDGAIYPCDTVRTLRNLQGITDD